MDSPRRATLIAVTGTITGLVVWRLLARRSARPRPVTAAHVGAPSAALDRVARDPTDNASVAVAAAPAVETTRGAATQPQPTTSWLAGWPCTALGLALAAAAIVLAVVAVNDPLAGRADALAIDAASCAVAGIAVLAAAARAPRS